MQRIISGYSELICKAFGIIPNAISERLQYVHFFLGSDPIFAGLEIEEEEFASDGRSYRDTAHVTYAHNQLHLPKYLRHTTVVMPKHLFPYVVVHELAHVLDEILGWEHIAKPVTEYAKSNREEAFAEAFTSWLFYNYGDEPDGATQELFRKLSVFEA